MTIRRSLLFVPGTRPDRFAKAASAGADLVCVDLEDAVAIDAKDGARVETVAHLADLTAPGVERLVRINALDTQAGLKDLDALLTARPAIDGLMIPKPRAAAEIAVLDRLLAATPWRLHVIIETADGLANVHALASASPRVAALLFGAVDMSADLGCALAWEPLLNARAQVAHAAARFGLTAMDVPWLQLDDMVGLEAEAARVKALGFHGKAAIHPTQLPVIHGVFNPSGPEIERARRIVDAFAASSGGLLVVDGALIEAPVLRQMQRTLDTAKRLGLA
jgi:citrate lyase beta subunit